MKIILDAMGGDNAPEAVVLGALDAVKDFNTEIILVGRGEEILAAMKKHGVSDLPAGIAITEARASSCFCPPERVATGRSNQSAMPK